MSNLGPSTVISFEEAQRIAMDAAPALDRERVPLERAVNRTLREDVVSDIDMPPFPKAAMDGYACRRADLDGKMAVVEVVPAGSLPQKPVGPGQCAKIMTGAMVPQGADCVVMVEFTVTDSAGRVCFTGHSTRDNICLQGEDVRAGEGILSSGTRILPQHIALLATAGCANPLVSRRPRVGIIATGDELVPPSRRPAGAQIRNSNGPQLSAQARLADAEVTDYGIAVDTTAALDQVIRKATTENDLLLLSGGVSMGDFDLVPGVLRSNGYELLFDRVATKPGKPTTFGRGPDCCCFGLPGNPVATFIVFEVLVKPFLNRMTGCTDRDTTIAMTMGADFTRKKTERMVWIPVRQTPDGRVVPVEYHGSAHVRALCVADGLISVPAGTAEIREGTPVSVRSIRP